VVLVSALLALLVREGRADLALVGVVPVLAFWGLDGYFLWQERLFRALYDQVRQLEEDRVDFSMNTAPFSRTWLRAIFSTTLCLFYGALAFAVAVAVAISVG